MDCVNRPVQNLDLVPTILEAAGLPVPAEDLAGVSLWPMIRGRERGDLLDQRVITAVTLYDHPTPTCSLSARQGGLKCIREFNGDRIRNTWYDLAVDPGEEQPLGAPPADWRTRAVTGALDDLGRDLVDLTAGPGSDLRSQLQAMGYLQ